MRKYRWAIGLGLPAIVAVTIAMLTTVTKAAQPAVVTVWSWRTQDTPMWQAVEAKLRSMGEDIRIEHRAITATQYDAVLSTAMQGGQGPDIIVARAGSTVASYAATGQFEPLKGKVDLSRFSAGVVDQVSYKDVPYAVPFAVQSLHVYYNKDIYKQLGLRVPQTWDEFIGNLRAIKGAGYMPLFVAGREAWTLPLIVEAIGATWLGNDWVKQAEARKKDFNDVRFVDVLRRIQELVPYFQDNFLASNYTDMDMAFSTGLAAHVVNGIWAHTTYQSNNPSLNSGIFPVPGASTSVPKQVYAFVDGGYAVNAASKVKDAAIKVVRFMATLEGGQIFIDTTREPSAVPGVKAPADDAILQQALSDYARVAMSPIFGIRSVFDRPPVSSERKQVEEFRGINGLLMEAVQGMFASQLTPEQAAKKVNDGLSWYFGNR